MIHPLLCPLPVACEALLASALLPAYAGPDRREAFGGRVLQLVDDPLLVVAKEEKHPGPAGPGDGSGPFAVVVEFAVRRLGLDRLAEGEHGDDGHVGQEGVGVDVLKDAFDGETAEVLDLQRGFGVLVAFLEAPAQPAEIGEQVGGEVFGDEIGARHLGLAVDPEPGAGCPGGAGRVQIENGGLLARGEEVSDRLREGGAGAGHEGHAGGPDHLEKPVRRVATVEEQDVVLAHVLQMGQRRSALAGAAGGDGRIDDEAVHHVKALREQRLRNSVLARSPSLGAEVRPDLRRFGQVRFRPVHRRDAEPTTRSMQSIVRYAMSTVSRTKATKAVCDSFRRAQLKPPSVTSLPGTRRPNSSASTSSSSRWIDPIMPRAVSATTRAKSRQRRRRVKCSGRRVCAAWKAAQRRRRRMSEGPGCSRTALPVKSLRRIVRHYAGLFYGEGHISRYNAEIHHQHTAWQRVKPTP